MSFGSRSLPPPTDEESRRITAAKLLGCIACQMDGNPSCGFPEYNHILAGNRAGHRYGYVLGAWHHRGVVREGWSHKDMRIHFGPSLAEGSKPFHARYGSDQELQDYQDDILGHPRAEIAARPRRVRRQKLRKVFPRPAA